MLDGCALVVRWEAPAAEGKHGRARVLTHGCQEAETLSLPLTSLHVCSVQTFRLLGEPPILWVGQPPHPRWLCHRPMAVPQANGCPTANDCATGQWLSHRPMAVPHANCLWKCPDRWTYKCSSNPLSVSQFDQVDDQDGSLHSPFKSLEFWVP